MAPAVTLTLGDFTFADFAIPERISVGGAQRLKVHELVGGVRTVDAMGRSDRPLSWSGTLLGENALSIAQTLDAMRVSGTQLTLTFSQYRYAVVISDFKPDIERPYLIPYTIECTVVADQSLQTVTQSTTTVDDAINTDFDNAQDYSDEVGDSTLSTLMSTLSTTISAVSSFAQATASVIASVQNPLQAVLARVGVLAAASSAASPLAGFAGITAGIGSSGSLTAQISLNTSAYNLGVLGNTLGRIANNLTAIGTSPNTVTVAGANLFSIADDQFGDPTQWTAIASANGLTDPFVTGPMTLVIPANPVSVGGILNA